MSSIQQLKQYRAASVYEKQKLVDSGQIPKHSLVVGKYSLFINTPAFKLSFQNAIDGNMLHPHTKANLLGMLNMDVLAAQTFIEEKRQRLLRKATSPFFQKLYAVPQGIILDIQRWSEVYFVPVLGSRLKPSQFSLFVAGKTKQNEPVVYARVAYPSGTLTPTYIYTQNKRIQSGQIIFEFEKTTEGYKVRQGTDWTYYNDRHQPHRTTGPAVEYQKRKKKDTDLPWYLHGRALKAHEIEMLKQLGKTVDLDTVSTMLGL